MIHLAILLSLLCTRSLLLKGLVPTTTLIFIRHSLKPFVQPGRGSRLAERYKMSIYSPTLLVSNLKLPPSMLLQVPSFPSLHCRISNLLALRPNLLASCSNLLALRSNLLASSCLNLVKPGFNLLGARSSLLAVLHASHYLAA